MLRRTDLNAAGTWYERYPGRILPRYALFSLPACLLLNCLIYWGGQRLADGAPHTDVTTPLDRMLPFVPAWIVVYFGCYLFWTVNYILIARQGKEHWFRFAAADMLSRCICGIVFLAFPTTNVRPAVPGTDCFSAALRFLYRIDAPTNLFPSIHCLVSWFCYIGIRGNRQIPAAYRAFSCAAALAVFASTLLTRQHCIPDVISGVLLAEACLALSRKTSLFRPLERAFEGLDRRAFGRKHVCV